MWPDLTVDLSLPFSAILVIVAGLVGRWTAKNEHLRQTEGIERTPDIQKFEQRHQHLTGTGA